MLSHLWRRHRVVSRAVAPIARSASRKAGKQRQPPPPPPPPTPPKPPQKPASFTFHDFTWQDPYSWMADLQDRVAMRHMDVYMEQEEKYTEAVMASLGAERLQLKLQTEMAARMASDLCSPPVRWGPWIYYRRIEEGKQYPILCRRSASLNEEFVSYSAPSAGFDFNAGKRIEQNLLDYNLEADRFGGYTYEELSEVSPDHRYLAYTLYDKDKDSFTLSVRDLASGTLFDKPQVDRVSNVAWAMDGKALLYVVTNQYRRPYKISCSMIGSKKEDILVLEESSDNVFVNIRNTKDFRFVTVNIFSEMSSKVIDHPIHESSPGYLYLFTDAARAGMPVDSHYLLRCAVKTSGSRTWENVLIEEPGASIVDADFCDTHLVLILREGKTFRICSICLPLPAEEAVHLATLNPYFLPLPKHVSQISPGPNYDYYSSTMRFVISSPVMPDAIVDYNLSNGKWNIVQQQNVLHEGTRTLYGTHATSRVESSAVPKNCVPTAEEDNSDVLWNSLSEYYACEYHDVPSDGGVMVPLTVIYSRKHKQEGNPCLLHGHGAYGEPLDKRWRCESKSLLDRGWVIAYADVRGGGRGKRWHHDGRRTKKQNSIRDYISCAQFLINKGLVQENKLAGWGYSAGGLLVASAINKCPDLFRAAVLKVPFLDACNTLLYPVLPLTPIEYEEFGCPGDIEDFKAIRNYSPYENIQKDTIYPALLLTSSFNTRFGVWEAAKWIAKVRDLTFHDPKRPKLLNLTADTVEESKYLESKELALELAFLIKMMTDS
ncbi:unnamed protein product [Spirodela intermedia]|uniref:Prolyl endopeptidase n=1 Tax=Spirodela intermedia TaxID=51605 RepID=A0A7I8IIT5_SPIIN|nr:unnamed protein product [Spirodela intermedia]CAA6657766.1 unnamed protein product [Spirodela intermedia]